MTSMLARSFGAWFIMGSMYSQPMASIDGWSKEMLGLPWLHKVETHLAFGLPGTI